jgi:hypothetical protein
MRGPGEVIRPVVGFIPIVVRDFNESRRVRIRNEGVSDEDRDPLVEFDSVAVEFDAVVGSRARTDSMRLEATAPDDDVKGATRELIDFASRPPSRGLEFNARLSVGAVTHPLHLPAYRGEAFGRGPKGHSPGGCDGGVADSSAVAASDESLTAQSGLTLFVVCRISASDMMFWSMWKATR